MNPCRFCETALVLPTSRFCSWRCYNSYREDESLSAPLPIWWRVLDVREWMNAPDGIVTMRRDLKK